MFQVRPTEAGDFYRLVIAGLLGLSVAALAVTIWIMDDLLREQLIVARLIELLPPEGDLAAERLAGELRWQFRLSILVVLNLVVTGFAMLLLWRAYRSSQESLRDLKALAGDILGSMDQAVITTDVDGIVTSINQRGCKLLGVQGDPVGKPLGQLTEALALDEFRQQCRQRQLTDQTRDFQFACDGTTKTLMAFCQPLTDRDHIDIGDVIQLRDVTERVLMDDRMRRMERYMSLGSLAAGLQHEIKNPLAALSLHVQLLEEELADVSSSPAVVEMLGVIKTEVVRIGGVLEGFRDFASVSLLNLVEVDLAELMDRLVKLLRPQTLQESIEVRLEIPPTPLPRLKLDRTRMEQVLLNLLINAMEAMPGGGTIRIAGTCQPDPPPGSVRIEIADTGTGIPENLRRRIFDPYFTTKSHGIGMGLALCDKIVRQHGGLLDFRTSERGSVFVITLPIL
jgi:PAS domain S-box-containing protein